MSETPSSSFPPPLPEQPSYGAAPTAPYGAPQQPAYGSVNPYGGPAAYGAMPMNGAPLGKIRSTGVCILLTIVTFGVYSWIWYYSTSEEMKRHSGQGLGGALSLVLAIFVGLASPFITSSEVGALYQRTGRDAPVSGLTGLWYFPGIFILVGPIVWFVKTNGALNAYWKSMGATA